MATPEPHPPYRTLAQAISRTNPGGEVVVLDSAGYGPVTIAGGINHGATGGVTRASRSSQATGSI